MEKELEQFNRLAAFLDDGFELPILKIKIGFDPIIGLIPFFGDAVSLVFNSFSLFYAFKLNASAWILSRMAFNILIDFSIGSVPLFGDMFDFFFKSNRKNYQLLVEFTKNESKLVRQTKWKAFGVLVTLLAIITGFVLLLYYFVAKLIELI